MKLKVRFLINTLGGGGAEKVLVDLLGRLDPSRYDVTLCTVQGGVHEAAVPSHVHFHKMSHCRNIKLQDLLGRVIRKLPAGLTARLFLRGQYDVEIAYLEGFPTRLLAAKKTSAPKLAFVHCDLSVNNLVKPFYRSDAECLEEYRTFTKVCFVSGQGMRGFETAYGPLDNACVVHNVIDTESIRRKSLEASDFPYGTQGVKLVTVGRLTQPKAYPRLLQLAAELEKRHNFELWIVGEGDERPVLEGMIRDMGIRSVRLLGFQSNPYRFVKEADLFVCSSYSEGYSTAVSEALVLGIPVITTDCAGMDEILDNGRYGLIVENSEEGLLRGLEQLLSSPEELARWKECALARSRELTADGALAEYEALFAGITDGNKN